MTPEHLAYLLRLTARLNAAKQREADRKLMAEVHYTNRKVSA